MAVIAARRLNRKTRIALAVLILLVLAGPVVVLRNVINSAQEGSQLVAPSHPANDGLVRLTDGTITFVQSPTLARKVSRWLELDTGADPAFEIADSNFVPNSAQLAVQGRAHVRQVARILNTDAEVRAQVLAVIGDRESAQAQLEQSRSATIRNELIRERVSPSNLTAGIRDALEPGEYRIIGETGHDTHLFIVLTR